MTTILLACMIVGNAMAATNPLRLTWSTDLVLQVDSPGLVPATFGPDGPWQAVVIGVGNTSGEIDIDGGRHGTYFPVIPSGANPTQLITREAGGNYSIEDSTTAVNTSTTIGQADSWFSTTVRNQTSIGALVFDNIVLGQLTTGLIASGNASIAANSNWSIPLRNGSAYQNQIGILGLGTAADEDPAGSPAAEQPWLLDEIKQSGSIPSNSFGMHIGSVLKNISGSLVLGGYDQARAIGPVGNFWYTDGAPYTILRDIKAGVVTGGSPFPADASNHLYTGNGGGQVTIGTLQQFGAPEGSSIMVPNPSYPYISLPPGNCEAIVARLKLPVTMDDSTGFYMWNQDDPMYATIINSPAHLEFILADTTATNISIKVPFSLLNLTLEAPIIDKPAPYFPCQSVYVQAGFWELGRAFLQAAFLGLSYEQNITFIAQAPGPSVEQSVFHDILPSDTNISSNSIDSFEQTWIDHWQVLDNNGTTSGVANPSDTSTSTPSGLSGGSIAGIVIGILVALAIAAAAFWFWRKRSHKPQEPAAEIMLPKYGYADTEMDGHSTIKTEIHGVAQGRPEMDGRNPVGPELGGYHPPEVGEGLVHEVEAPVVRHELGI